MGKDGKGILKLADYFRRAKNPCPGCKGTGIDPFDAGTCLDCHGEKRL